jgi:hypothetical protein
MSCALPLNGKGRGGLITSNVYVWVFFVNNNQGSRDILLHEHKYEGVDRDISAVMRHDGKTCRHALSGSNMCYAVGRRFRWQRHYYNKVLGREDQKGWWPTPKDDGVLNYYYFARSDVEDCFDAPLWQWPNARVKQETHEPNSKTH